MSNNRSYEPTSPDSIERYAKQLVGLTLRDVIAEEAPVAYQTGKGRLGDIVERSYFGINPGNISGPDFAEAGVELKTTPLKRVGKKLRAKERLVLQMIDYMTVHREEWTTSSFLAKNSSLLLLFYLWEPDTDELDYVFRIARLWSFPDEDLEIIRRDWETIVAKIREGRAHELSEGDTMYLSACVKAATGADRRPQPFSDLPAKPRAFSLKASYMNSVIDNSLRLEPSVSAADLKGSRSFEQVVHDRFKPYLGMTAAEIAEALDVRIQVTAKNFYAILTKRILGVGDKSRIAEFEKADVTLKTVRLKHTGMPKEAVSFKAFDYLDLVQQEWESSSLRSDLTRRFFFVIYQLDRAGTPTLSRTKFWTMPIEDVDSHGRRCFERTVELILDDKAEELPGSGENKVCHVRPHGRNKSDTLPTPSGRQVVRKSFWLNQRYLAERLAEDSDS